MSQTVEPSISCSPFVRSSCAASSTLRARVTESKCIALRSLYVGRARAQLARVSCMFAAGSLFSSEAVHNGTKPHTGPERVQREYKEYT